MLFWHCNLWTWHGGFFITKNFNNVSQKLQVWIRIEQQPVPVFNKIPGSGFSNSLYSTKYLDPDSATACIQQNPWIQIQWIRIRKTAFAVLLTWWASWDRRACWEWAWGPGRCPDAHQDCRTAAAPAGCPSRTRTPAESCSTPFQKKRSVLMGPHHVDSDPDSTYLPRAEPDADLDSDFYLMRIRIRLFTLMRIWIRIQILASK